MPTSIGFRVDTGDTARAAADLRTAAGRLPDALRRGVRSAADPIADGIRAEASWSTRIPAAVSVRASGNGAAVTVDPAIAPEAAALNNQDRPGTFQHPVFGNAWSVAQRARPFLVAGARRGQAEADRRFDAALTRLEHTAGFK